MRRALFLLLLAFAMLSCAAADARPSRARKHKAMHLKASGGDAAAAYAREEAELAELRGAKELPVAPRDDLDFPGQQLDDSERPPRPARKDE